MKLFWVQWIAVHAAAVFFSESIIHTKKQQRYEFHCSSCWASFSMLVTVYYRNSGSVYKLLGWEIIVEYSHKLQGRYCCYYHFSSLRYFFCSHCYSWFVVIHTRGQREWEREKEKEKERQSKVMMVLLSDEESAQHRLNGWWLLLIFFSIRLQQRRLSIFFIISNVRSAQPPCSVFVLLFPKQILRLLPSVWS